MAYIAVDKDGDEWIFGEEPYRNLKRLIWLQDATDYVSVPKGTILKIIGKQLTWSDDAVELE